MEIIDFLDGNFKYDEDGQFIWLVDSEGKLQKIADLRGWGAIQNLFKDDKGIIDSDKASKFQDAIGEWIVNALNSKLEEEKQDHKKDVIKIVCDRCEGKPESDDNILCDDCYTDLHGM